MTTSGIDPDLRILMLQLDDPGRDALERVIDRVRKESRMSVKPQPQARERKPRRPGVGTLLTQAESAGKSVSKIMTPDGTVLSFGEPQPTEAANPWLADIEKQTKQ